MKKFSLLLILIFSFLTLFSCGKSRVVEKVVIDNVSDNSSLVVYPHYKDRTLEVSYTYGDEKSMDTSKGSLGGEFFDRFEQVYKVVSLAPVKQVEKSSFVVSYNLIKSKKSEVKIFSKEDKEESVLEAFYIDVKDLLTEVSPV